MTSWAKWALGSVATLAVASAVWEPLIAQEEPAPSARRYDVEIVRDRFGVPHINVVSYTHLTLPTKRIV